jgi:hypothetical protein
VAGSEPAIAAAGAAAPGPAFARPGVPPADAVTREGGVAATPLQVKRDPQLNKSEGRPFPGVIESQSGRIGGPPLQAQNYNAGSRCRSMATSREVTSENAV